MTVYVLIDGSDAFGGVRTDSCMRIIRKKRKLWVGVVVVVAPEIKVAFVGVADGWTEPEKEGRLDCARARSEKRSIFGTSRGTRLKT